MRILLLLAGCGPQATPQFPDPAIQLFARLDRDGSGALEAEELMARHPGALLEALDTDGDGRVSLEELRADLEADHDATTGGAIGFGPR